MHHERMENFACSTCTCMYIYHVSYMPALSHIKLYIASKQGIGARYTFLEGGVA